MSGLDRRTALALAAALGTAASTPSFAQAERRTYALMSLIGDEVRVVGHESTTGTVLNQNPVETIRLPAGEIDRGVLAQMLKAVTREEPLDKALPIRVNDPRYYAGQAGWVAGERLELPAEVADALRGAGATHALLVLKHRDEARLRVRDTTLGTGRLEGLGFYLDRVTPLRLYESGEFAPGFLAPYVYIRVVLADLAGARVVSERRITRADVIPMAGSSVRGSDPWNLLDSAAKVNAITSMIERELGPVLQQAVRRP